MNVPPYVPQPIEIPGNVTEESYGVRLQFIRRVVALYLLSVAGIAAAALLSSPIGYFDFVLCGLSLLLLSGLRGLTKGRAVEQRISAAASPLLFAGLGLLVHRLDGLGWPTWIF